MVLLHITENMSLFLCIEHLSYTQVIVWYRHKWTATGSGISNSDLVEPNRIRNLIYALLFANFITLKMPHTCTYRSTMQYIHPMLAVTSITFLRLM